MKKRRKQYSAGAIIWIIFKYVSLVFFSFVAVIPIISCVITAFKTEEEYKTTNVMTLPQNWLNVDNFVEAFQRANMGRAFFNSVIVMVCVLIGAIIIGTQLAYVLNRFQFPGNGLIRNLFLFAALLPGVAMQVTVYQIMHDLGFINHLYGYIIMMMGTDVISIYIFIQYMENIPVSLDESAIIDGASYWKIYWKIMLPLLKPGNRDCLHLKGRGRVQRILFGKPVSDEGKFKDNGDFPLYLYRTAWKPVQPDLCRRYHFPAAGTHRVYRIPEADLQRHYGRCSQGLIIGKEEQRWKH